MANTNNMNRIPAWDGSAEMWTEYENEVLWFEESLKPSERPQLVARLFEALSRPDKKATQSESTKTFSGKYAEQYPEFLQKKVGILPIVHLGDQLDDCFFPTQAGDGRVHGIMEHQIRWCVPTSTICLATSDWKENRSCCARQFCPDET